MQDHHVYVLNDLADDLLTTWFNPAVFPVLSTQISIAPRFIKYTVWIATVIICCPQTDIREMERIYGLGRGHVTPWYTRSAGSCDADSAQVSLSFRVWHTFANWRKHMKYAHGIIMTSQWVPWHLKSPTFGLLAQPIVQGHIIENIKASCVLLAFWGESTCDWWIPHKKSQ